MAEADYIMHINNTTDTTSNFDDLTSDILNTNNDTRNRTNISSNSSNKNKFISLKKNKSNHFQGDETDGLIISNEFREDDVEPDILVEFTSAEPSPTNTVVCLFVVLFHVTRGHEIIWSMPHDLDLTGVEFKALPSGMHTIGRDCIYFRKGGLYGLSYYAKRTLNSSPSLEYNNAATDERGARMMAVGVLCLSYDHLPSHTSFLSTVIHNLLVTPNDYSHLEEYYGKNMLQPHKTSEGSKTNLNENNISICIANASILSTYTSGHDFARFVQILGPNIFILWKFLLLQSRVIFFTKPPIGPACNWAYFSCLLAACDVIPLCPNPHFYVSVADLDSLKEETHFIACTTEQIIQTKKAHYDVFITLQASDGRDSISHADIKSSGILLRPLLYTNNTDIIRYKTLTQRCEGLRGSIQDRGKLNKICIEYFRELNNTLFSHMIDYSRYGSIINPHLLRKAGLDSYGDFTFLRHFCRVYNFELSIQRDPEVANLLCCAGINAENRRFTY